MDFEFNQILIAFIFTLIAGLSTSIGAFLVLIRRKVSKSMLVISLGFSAGVMIYISFVEILHSSTIELAKIYGQTNGAWMTMLAFFSGIGIILIIDKLVPDFENPHEPHFGIEDYGIEHKADMDKIKKMGILTALAITIHNVPEGMAVFTSSLQNPAVGLPIVIAIAIHNIPEGIAVAIPFYYSTNSRKKAFWLATLSGLAEPVGAIIAFMLLSTVMNDSFLGFILGMVAGIMVYISIDELIPAAKKYDSGHKTIYSLVAGMAVMAISLALLGGHAH